MPTQEFNCPNCGAPLDYPGSGTTMRCPYCESSVVVPAEIRTQAVGVQRAAPIPYLAPSKPVRTRSGTAIIAIAVGVVLCIGVVTALVILGINRATKRGPEIVEQAQAPVTLFPSPTNIPEPTGAPEMASPVTTFGSSGIGAGLLNDARYIAVDGSGTVYVADYQDGRIQAFDPEGKFLHGWQVGDADTIIHGMAASLSGIVYVTYDGDIYRYEGDSGKQLDKLNYANGKEFGDLTPLPDGGVLGVWYEGRWGIITSLEGHRDDLVWFDADGKEVRTLESAISGQTGDLELDTTIAVDGQGTVYALSRDSGAVFKFSAQGKFIDRFGEEGDNPEQFPQGDCLAVDGQGRVYVGGGQQVTIYSPEGSYLYSFKTAKLVDMMAFNVQGDLYIVSRDTVSRYSLGQLPK